MSVFQMGPHTHAVPMTLFRENRDRLCSELRKAGAPPSSVVVLEGGKTLSLYDTDVEYVFRQESNFQWLFAVKEPDFYGAVVVSTGKSVLFAPHLPPDYAVWQGPLHSPEDFRKMYEVDEVHFLENMADVLQALAPDARLLTLSGENSDSRLKLVEPTFHRIKEFKIDNEFLYPIFMECRVMKSPKELEVLRYVARISSEAHKKVMLRAAPEVTEYQCESEFLNYCYGEGGCRQVSYTCICGSGTNSAILHYGHAAAPNDRMIKDGDMCLFDMGANYCGYVADITCSFPANGKFSDDQKLIYNAVLDANRAVMAAAKPGVSWVHMHDLANTVMLTKLKEGGLLKGEVDDMMKNGLAAVFQPHGLGHFIGLDVHDVGAYLRGCPPRPTGPNNKRLRTARVLKAGMCITIEPGCYFIDPLLDQALAHCKQSQFLVKEVIQRFRGFGGVRIEDDVIITETGVEDMTFVPRTIEEIEAWMAQRRQ